MRILIYWHLVSASSKWSNGLMFENYYLPAMLTPSSKSRYSRSSTASSAAPDTSWYMHKDLYLRSYVYIYVYIYMPTYTRRYSKSEVQLPLHLIPWPPVSQSFLDLCAATILWCVWHVSFMDLAWLIVRADSCRFEFEGARVLGLIIWREKCYKESHMKDMCALKKGVTCLRVSGTVRTMTLSSALSGIARKLLSKWYPAQSTDSSGAHPLRKNMFLQRPIGFLIFARNPLMMPYLCKSLRTHEMPERYTHDSTYFSKGSFSVILNHMRCLNDTHTIPPISQKSFFQWF